MLEGSVHIVKEDFWGNANLMAECVPGDIFGEAYAINSTEPLEMNIFAASTCRVLFLEVSKILTVCSLRLCVSQPADPQSSNVSVPEKFPVKPQIRTYVQAHHQRETALLPVHGVEKANASTFTIPFNRQQLADYLSVDRSAMSNELCKLRDAGILEFNKKPSRFLRKTIKRNAMMLFPAP